MSIDDVPTLLAYKAISNRGHDFEVVPFDAIRTPKRIHNSNRSGWGIEVRCATASICLRVHLFPFTYSRYQSR